MRNDTFPVIKDVVLIGGGHAHVAVLRSFGMFPIKGVRVTLISPEIDTPYSGMLPGLVSGHYTFDEAHIDLGPLATFAGARHFVTHVTGIDPDLRLIACADGRPPVGYDVVSLDVGSTPVFAAGLELAREPIPVKPVSRFLAAWERLQARVLENPDLRIGIVGAGAGGVELLLSMQHALAMRSGAAPGRGPGRFVIATRDDKILATHNDKARRAFKAILETRGVEVVTGFEATRFDDEGLWDGARHVAVDEAIWVTGAAAPAWFRDTGLAVDARGFIAVNDKLQSTSHTSVFGAGDCVTMVNDPRPKSGVFAVRQGPVLTKNLRATMLARPLERYKPQARFLSLISTGDRGAVASWGNWSAKGNWVWRWKDSIDTKFMKTFNELPRMDEIAPQVVPTVADVPHDFAEAVKPDQMRCKGCGAKVGAQTLKRVLGRIGAQGGCAFGCAGQGAGLLTIAGGDDAAAFDVPAGTVLVQSVDQFPVPVSDPFVGGQITANHCLGDLYAMGAEPHSALATVTLPLAVAERREGDLEQLMAGALAVFREAGSPIIGGHTGEGAEQMLGFTVNGLAVRDDLQLKSGLNAGAALVLTKPIGTGALLAAIAKGAIRGRHLVGATEVMKRSNREAALILAAHGAKGMTDVTGFGLLGHLGEMLVSAGLGARLRLDDVALIEGARAAVAAGHVSSLQGENVRAAGDIAAPKSLRERPAFRLLFDPQTAGGLLAGVPAETADAAVAELIAAGYDGAAVIGEVVDGAPAGRVEVA